MPTSTRFLMWLTAILLASHLSSATGEEISRPVFEPGVEATDRAGLEQVVKPLLEISEAELVAMVPQRNGLIFCGCPNCDAGSHELELDWMGWSDPDRVKCRYCDMVYPNDQYPQAHSMTATNPHNQEVTYRYFQEGENTYFFSALARYRTKQWLSGQTLQLARLAYVSQDESHERRVILLLDAFRQAYSGWCVMLDRSFHESGPLDSYPDKPRPYYGGIWSRWFYGDIPQELLRAYDLIYESNQWDELSAQLKRDIRGQLESELFRAAVVFTRGYEEKQSNKSPGLYKGLIVAGRVLREPDYVHDAVDRFQRLLRQPVSIRRHVARGERVVSSSDRQWFAGCGRSG